MKLKTFFKCLYYCLFLVSNIAKAQVNGSLLNEIQVGNIPNRTPNDLVANYTRFNLNANYKNFSFRSMSEVFVSQNKNTSYIFPSQISLQYKSKHIEAKLGNVYETIGRGNILRGYEIPGSILEDKIFRSRSYFYKDLLGGTVKYSADKFNIKLIGGKPLDNLVPPTQSLKNRRSESVFAINPEYKFKKLKVGSGLMTYTNTIEKHKIFLSNYASFATGNNSLYFELSNQLKVNNSYAFYGGYSFTKGDFGGSIEVKDYKNFLIGTGINQPPALVREHIYRVLNRSTHVLLPENERGMQAEFFYNKSNHLFTLNQTIAVNNFSKRFLYAESFFEYQYNYENGNSFKTFFDFARDDFNSEKNRLSIGAQRDFSLKKKKLKVEFEAQTFNRSNQRVINQVYGISYIPKSNLTISPVLEITNDPFLTDNTKFYLGAYSRLVLKSKYTIQAFVGERRGGPACNAGICYEVLDFKGAELKGVIRF